MEIVDRTRGGTYRPLIHARRSAAALALCGAAPFNPWSNSRVAVSCPGCVAEIERRVATRSLFRTRAGVPRAG